MGPLISVIIPVFNVERYLKRCLDSVINQTYKKLEIILVNDGSTDKSGEICDSYASIDKRVKVIHKKTGDYQMLETLVYLKQQVILLAL